MLELDADTKDIPVVTCTVTTEEEVATNESVELPDDVFKQSATLRLN
jgi:hypothetical protein